ncbi:MAG TPA: nuclear transport factor 2 family protein [Thermoanaerobaculia bacterium]|nr:nuclear transport factor 2 family protein [Thermoanaerobaculia bacterium]
MRETAAILTFLSLLSWSVEASASETSTHRDNCALATTVVSDAYIDGLWRDRNADAVRRGFHPGFVLQVLDDDRLISVTLDEWLNRLRLDGKRNPQPISGEVRLLHCVGSIAAVKVELFESERHRYTDHFELYRFSNGWKIVAKTFHDPSD